MIPLRLHLRNFMCYRDSTALDLTGIRLACLAGDNGHGKSALLDAMTWALWGRARARYDDELVTTGQSDMEVQLDFLLDSTHYRVIRKRELGQHSRSALEFQIRHEDRFRALTAATQRATQAQINQVLRMDYDTFINSALLLQGRADEFTVKAPADRKRVLAEILGLDVYDEYEQRAKALAQEKEAGAREAETRIQEIERELAHLPQYEQDLAATQEQLAQLNRQARSAEADLLALRDKYKALEAQQTRLIEVQNRIRTAEASVDQLDEQVKALKAKIHANESILQRREKIEADHANWLEAREQEAAWAAMLPRLLALNKDKAVVEKRIAEAKQQLELKAHAVEERIATHRETSEQSARWQGEHLEASKQLQELAARQDRLETLKAKDSELALQIAQLETESARLKQDMTTLQEKIELLKEPTAACPLCGQALSQQERLRVLAEVKAEGLQKGKAFRSRQRESERIAAEKVSLNIEIGPLQRDLKRLPAIQGLEARLRKSIEDAQEATKQIAELQQELQRLQDPLRTGAFAAKERDDLHKLETAIAALGYDQARHEQAQRRVMDLAAFEDEKARLQQAEQVLHELRSNTEQLCHSRQSWNQSLEQDRRTYAELQAGLDELPKLAQVVQSRQVEVDGWRAQENRTRQLIGVALQKRDQCHYWAQERKDRAAQLEQLLEDYSLYHELQLAFGKKGLQALIIEAAIPEIEAEANQLLSRMTEGRMSLRFDTQRDTKSGNTIETLEIKIADEAGPRSYELYSGGEAFRINLAIRIALSKLLVRRAGARLQTLIIDEGFGTQDTEGRQRMVEAIRCIQDDFGLILVITHIEELKDAFPVRIDVFKTPEGSRVSVT